LNKDHFTFSIQTEQLCPFSGSILDSTASWLQHSYSTGFGPHELVEEISEICGKSEEK
jgi:hypothetical protein